jgi:hypothetical protein
MTASFFGSGLFAGPDRSEEGKLYFYRRVPRKAGMHVDCLFVHESAQQRSSEVDFATCSAPSSYMKPLQP